MKRTVEAKFNIVPHPTTGRSVVPRQDQSLHRTSGRNTACILPKFTHPLTETTSPPMAQAPRTASHGQQVLYEHKCGVSSFLRRLPSKLLWRSTNVSGQERLVKTGNMIWRSHNQTGSHGMRSPVSKLNSSFLRGTWGGSRI